MPIKSLTVKDGKLIIVRVQGKAETAANLFAGLAIAAYGFSTARQLTGRVRILALTGAVARVIMVAVSVPVIVHKFVKDARGDS